MLVIDIVYLVMNRIKGTIVEIGMNKQIPALAGIHQLYRV